MEKDLKGFYAGRVSSLRNDISRLKRRNRMFVCAELTTFIAAVALIAAFTVDGGRWLLAAAALVAVGYVAVRRLDVSNGRRTERLTDICSVYENELKYLEGDFSPFDDGSRYADAAHPFTYDMDVFGPQSLFHRINRTVTSGGSDELARMLSELPCDGMAYRSESYENSYSGVANAARCAKTDETGENEHVGNDGMGENRDAASVADAIGSNADGMGENHQKTAETSHFIEYIKQQHDAIDRMADMEALRTEFISLGRKGQADTAAVKKAIENVRQTHMPGYAGKAAAAVAAYISLTVFATTVLLAIFTPLTSGVPVLWGTVQLFAALMLSNGPLRAIGKSAGRLSKEMKAYYGLISILKNEERRMKNEESDKPGSFSSASANGFFTLHSSFFIFSRSSFSSAPAAFGELSDILSALDRRGNVLGLMIFDACLLSDFFLVRRFLRWRQRYIGRIGTWIDEVSRADALISMATFRYNEPQAGSAEITDSIDIVYEAKGLWHPFLGPRAVRNDFTISDSHYYIVTGANMAGKSTFLRSLGVNYILAMNGMPVFAERLRVSIFSLFSSMRTTDDLAHGISYFNAELLRLKQLIAHCQGHRRTLIILDEILKGTNSLDKLNGSRMFLDAIKQLPVSGVIATHDLELSRMADNEPGRFHNWCFEIRLSDDITYTYRITPGVARNQNATYLLRGIIAGIRP